MKYIIKAQKCKKCGDVIFSASHHHYKSCECGAIAVDGGPYIEGDPRPPYYNRYIGNFADFAETTIERKFDGGYLDLKRVLHKEAFSTR